jgi:transcriptional regulator with XRE-family HTH domain
MQDAKTKSRELTAAEREVIDRIKARVRARGSTMAKLAREIGATTNAGSQWGSYRSLPKHRSMVAIARNLEVSVNWLLTGFEEPADRPLTAVELETLAAMRELPPDKQALILATVKAWRVPDVAKK